MTAFTAIRSCAATACAFNHDGCTAPAITVGGTAGAPACGTLVVLDARGGLPVAQGRVGTGQSSEARRVGKECIT